ncbi:hypothetical protein DFH28DRAFT_922934 [Melampsora americana]|nr:hypothetical protein DFH28DRAFT_922934 [Melampsora americana]
MSISKLLNPANENPEESTETAAEWFALQQEPDIEDNASDIEILPVPSAQEALKAVSLLFRFIEGNKTIEGTSIDSQLRKLEEMLVSQVRFGNKRQAVLSDFFSQQ